MDLASKFDSGKGTCTYQRIDSKYKVNIYLGYNNDGKMSFSIIEKGRMQSIKSSKFIDVSIKKRKDGKLVLSFDLLDTIYSSLFVVFCKDLIITCEDVGKNNAISQAIARWKYWVELFGQKYSKILDISKIKGLFGELSVLDKYLIPLYGYNVAIKGWLGPLMGHKDFEVDSTWYEVKTISDNAVQLTINSLEQLDSNIDGHLVVVRINETSEANVFSSNLNKLVLEIVNKIDDSSVLNCFREKLNELGYHFTAEYEKYNYLVENIESYTVNSSFPKLTKRNIDKAICEAKYNILIPEIFKFKE